MLSQLVGRAITNWGAIEKADLRKVDLSVNKMSEIERLVIYILDTDLVW